MLTLQLLNIFYNYYVNSFQLFIFIFNVLIFSYYYQWNRVNKRVIS